MKIKIRFSLPGNSNAQTSRHPDKTEIVYHAERPNCQFFGIFCLFKQFGLA